MNLAVLFVVIFALGPLAFIGLSRRWLAHWPLAAGIFACLAIGFALQLTLAEGARAYAAFFLFWLAWVGTLAFFAARFTQRWPTMRRWSRVAGATGTTMPWFGLLTAAWIAG